MRNYKTTPDFEQAFRLTIEGVSLNATASRMGMSSGRVRYALHNECKIRCPKLYASLVRYGDSPSLDDLRTHSVAFIGGADLGCPAPSRHINANSVSTDERVPTEQPSFLSRMFTAIFS